MVIKKDSAKSSFDSIIIANPYTGLYSIVKNNTIDPIAKPSFIATRFTSSYLSNKEMIVSSLYISRRVPDEDLRSAIEIKAEEDLGINGEEYIIDFFEVESNTEDRLFHIFVVKADELYKLFNAVKNDVKYIDLIVPAPLLYNVLYKQNILLTNEVHIFIYFMHHDAFITIYKNGNFAYSKALDQSLDKMYDRYCELTGQHSEKDTFLNLLKHDASQISNTASQEALMKIFRELFLSINDVIIYVKRSLKLESIDEIYICSDIGEISDINEHSLSYLGKQSKDFNFNYNIGTNTQYVANKLELLLAKTSIDYIENDTPLPNMTQFHRPPSFEKRPGGKFLISIGIAAILGLTYPLFYLLSSFINNIQIIRYTYQSNELSSEVEHYKKTIEAKKNEIKLLSLEEKREAEAYHAKEVTLNTIYDKKVNYRMKSQTFYDLANDLQQYGVSVDKLQNNDNNFSLSLISDGDRKVTELIKYISNKYYNVIKKIDIKLIEKDQNGTYYKGILTMEFK